MSPLDLAWTDGSHAALTKFAAFTPAFLRTIARDSDVAIDEPEFREKCRGLTGKAHLDEMSAGELGQVAKMLWSDKKAEAAEQPKKKKTHAAVKALKGVGAVIGATAVQGAAGHAAMSGEGARGKHDFSKSRSARRLAKDMGEKKVPLAPKNLRHHGPGMGHVSEKKDSTSKGLNPGLYLPEGTSETIAAHEMGHLKNWRAIKSLAGGAGANAAFNASQAAFLGSQLLGLPATMYAAGSDDPSWTPAVAHTALAAPRLLDEAAASLHAVKHLIGKHGLVGGLSSSARLAPAFGTYAIAGGAPLAITALRKYLKRREDDAVEGGGEYAQLAQAARDESAQ